MAIVVQRYVQTGPTAATLSEVVQAGALVVGFSGGVLDIQFDDTPDGATAEVDEFMAGLGYSFHGSAPPVATPLYARSPDGVFHAIAIANDGSLLVDGDPVGGGGPINELWGSRTAPHAADDEFDTNALDSSWSQTGFGAALNFGVRPAPYVSPADNRASWENLRDPDNTTDPTQNSWMRIQPGNGPAGLWKRIDTADFGGAVPANLLVWARFRFAWRNAQGVAAADNDIGLSFFQESGAGFSFAVHATINLNNTQEGAVGNVIKPLFWGRNGAVIANNSEGARMNNSANNRSDYAFYSGYVGLQKVGPQNYHAWVLDDGGRLYMGEYVNAGLVNINAVALWCRGNSTGGMGVPIFDIDFIRFYQGSNWIP